MRSLKESFKDKTPKPEWLKIRLNMGEDFLEVRRLIDNLTLHTVCQEARCPNIYECWSNRTATFMIGGDVCTRRCGFCAVSKGAPKPLDPYEPLHVAEAVRQLNLQHAVITSVN
ncbi:MAG: lipoyl synthase, partial [Blastocatellia bacterium]|nr:lipoyl synthase [Blastocatellia bacterium]